MGSTTRTYVTYLPQSLAASTSVPFLFVFHGDLMSGAEMVSITDFEAVADREGFAVVFPDGIGGAGSLLPPWNVEEQGQTVCGAGQLAVGAGDDFAFMDAMKADIAEDQCLDDAHVFATGFSMGGYFSHHIGCYRSDVHAVAAHSGGTIDDLSACTTGPVPVLIFHGTGDPIINEACDDPTSTAPVSGFPASATLWAKKNGCSATYSTTAVESDGGTGQCYLFHGCPTGGQVELCTFNGMGHCWAGGNNTGSDPLNACPAYASATELAWSFFKTYAW